MPIKYIPIRDKTVYSFGGGANEVRVLSSSDTTNYWVDLGGGDDIAVLGAGNDTIIGGKGSDTIDGGQGDDTIYGGIDGSLTARNGEFDRLSGDTAVTQVNGGYVFGDDTIYGAVGSSLFQSQIFGDNTGMIGGGLQCGNDDLWGGSGFNYIYGDANQLFGGAIGGNDWLRLYGGSSNDFLYGDARYLAGTGARGGDDHIELSHVVGEGQAFGDSHEFQSGFGGDDYLQGSGNAGASSLLWGDAYHISTPDYSGPTTAIAGDDVLVALGGYNQLVGDATVVNGSLIAPNDFAGGTVTLGDDILDASGAASGSIVFMWGDAYLIYANSGSTITCGDDTLKAGMGADTMRGDYEATVSDGGSSTRGADTFIFSGLAQSGGDVILDFEQGVDSIVFEDLQGTLVFTAAQYINPGDSTRITVDGDLNWALLIVGVPGLTLADVVLSP
jgi:hypothetical protein